MLSQNWEKQVAPSQQIRESLECRGEVQRCCWWKAEMNLGQVKPLAHAGMLGKSQEERNKPHSTCSYGIMVQKGSGGHRTSYELL